MLRDAMRALHGARLHPPPRTWKGNMRAGTMMHVVGSVIKGVPADEQETFESTHGERRKA